MAVWSEDEWRGCTGEEHDAETIELLRRYHQDDCRKRYHEKVRISVKDHFSKSDLICLQNLVLGELHRREIALEVLPTSNVRISFYRDHKEHHIWRWLRLSGSGSEFTKVPPIVIGTDDAGIFATNIYNEYVHIYHQLVTEHGQDHKNAEVIIQKLMQNAKVYGFGVEGGP
jgi:hypothetical protein